MKGLLNFVKLLNVAMDTVNLCYVGNVSSPYYLNFDCQIEQDTDYTASHAKYILHALQIFL